MGKDKDAWREYKRGYNALLKKNHLCRNCKAQDAHTLAGFVLCWDCRDKAVKRLRERSKDPDVRAQKVKYGKELYARRKEQGLCPVCGGKRTDSNFIMCRKCRFKKSNKKKARQASVDNNFPRGGNGICYRCNREPALPGMRTCAACRDYLVGLAKNARKNGKGFKPIVFGRGWKYQRKGGTAGEG